MRPELQLLLSKSAISLADLSSDVFQILRIPWLYFLPCPTAKSNLQRDSENKHTLKKGMMSAQVSLLLFIIWWGWVGGWEGAVARHNTFPRKPYRFPSFTSARAPEHGDACDPEVGTSRLLLSPVLDEKYQAGNGNEWKKVKEQLHFFPPLCFLL